MELSETGSLVMASCSGSSQQQWVWKRTDLAAFYVKKQKPHSRTKTPTITSAVELPQKVAQEIAVGDY